MSRNHRKNRNSPYTPQQSEYFYKAPRTNNQKIYFDYLNTKFVTIAHGTAGTGKTLFALQKGLQLLERHAIDTIYYVRNNCDNKEVLGSKGRGEIPGGVMEKSLPLLAPLLDNLKQLTTKGKSEYLVNKETIKPLIFDDLLGRSLDNCLVIADELENVPPAGIKLLMTRLAENSQLVMIGDSEQKTLGSRYDDGLNEAIRRLQGCPDVGIVRLGLDDIQRNPRISSLLRYWG